MAAFVEPTSRLPLRWGRYRDRTTWGLLLVVGGTIALAGADTFQLLILLAGTIACIVGWAIIPSDGWRRIAVAVPATLAGWLLLAGPRFVLVLVLPYLAWMLVRHRPALAWLTTGLVVAVALVVAELVTGYGDMLAALGVEAAALAVAAALARGIAVRRASRQVTARSA
ncbi:MAG: hypothetical protein HY996_02905 [Micrococcales bacterium]|nr:hypothetical protein [Micrococcales bacterium]